MYELPDGHDPTVALGFLTDAMAQLVDFPISGTWQAVILTQH